MRFRTLLITAACAAAPVLAADYRVNGGVAGNLGGGSSPLDSYDISTVGSTASGSAAGGNNDGATAIAGAAWSVAGAAGLRAFAEATAQQFMDAGPVGKQASAAAYASMSYADMQITGAPGGFTTTSVNADLDGLFAAQGTLNSFGRGQVQVVFIVGGVNVGGGSQIFTANNSGNSTVSNGSLQGWNASGTITSPSFSAPVGQPFEVELQLSVVSEATGPGNEFFFAQGRADFGHTLSFARNGPVFNLAAGLTLNSAEAGIADNLLTPVPEPPALALALAGLALLAARLRRR